jgi:PQQ-dependent catabolism-associated CXXCW motif protein
MIARAARLGRSLIAGLFLAAGLGLAGAPASDAEQAAGEVPVPDGYRMSDYSAPVPDRLPGATTIDAARAAELLAGGDAVFIDVIPTAPRPEDREQWNQPTKSSLPTAHWLPNVGRGEIPDATDAYFREHLRRLTGGDKTRPLVIFCKPNCWMSWNAAKRALHYEYSEIYWFPGGTAAWRDAGHELERVAPVGEIPR